MGVPKEPRAGVSRGLRESMGRGPREGVTRGPREGGTRVGVARNLVILVGRVLVALAVTIGLNTVLKVKYRPFHKTLPRSVTNVNWIPVRFDATGCILSYFSRRKIS